MNETQTSQQEQIAMALDCWYVTGATASGKSAVGLELAQLFDAEIISLDSMAIYRGMDIGTAKPSAADRHRTAHHMLDIVDPVEEFTVSRYRDMAIKVAREIRGRGKQVIFVGGTALYLKAMLRGIFQGPPANWEFRSAIEQELESVGLDALYARLELVDPVTASKLHRNDKRRIIRALEVHSTTGIPISHLQNEFDIAHSPENCKVFTLRHPRNILHERIGLRVEKMFNGGLVTEVAALLARWTELGRTAAQAVGYREVIDHLRNGTSLDETRELTLFRTRKFARHQETWFRGLQECRILDLPDSEEDDASRARQIAEQIAASVSPAG